MGFRLHVEPKSWSLKKVVGSRIWQEIIFNHKNEEYVEGKDWDKTWIFNQVWWSNFPLGTCVEGLS